MKTSMQFFALVLLCTGLSFPAFSQDMPLEKSPIVDLDLTLSPGHALPKPNTSSGVTEIPQPWSLSILKMGTVMRLNVLPSPAVRNVPSCGKTGTETVRSTPERSCVAAVKQIRKKNAVSGLSGWPVSSKPQA